MKMRTSILVGSLLLLSTQPSPAPIQESQETPTPSPQVSATPSATPNTIPSIAPSKQEAARFAGMWAGRIKSGNANDVEFTLIVNPEATSLIQKSQRLGEFAHPTTVNAGTLSWTAGPKNGIVWTLTPNADAQTAVVKVRPASGEESTANFVRAESPTKHGRAGTRVKSRQ